MTSADVSAAAAWLSAHEEDHAGNMADLNQYWYSAATVASLLSAVRERCLTSGDHGAPLDVAFVSTPSLFFALQASERGGCRVLDFDKALGAGVPSFTFYDYNSPTALPAELQGAFAMVVIDPPYITREVWAQYVKTARWLLHGDGGLVLLTTVVENAPFLHNALGVTPNVFLPSIPELPYQYAVYSNFEAAALQLRNAEVPQDPEEILAAAREPPAAAAARDVEAPIRGVGAGAYDFEALLQAELARHEAPAAGGAVAP